MVIKGRVLCLLALALLVFTRKLANQSLLSRLRLLGMGAPTPARLLPAKAGHLNQNLTNRNLTHLAPRRTPPFSSHPVTVLRD